MCTKYPVKILRYRNKLTNDSHNSQVTGSSSRIMQTSPLNEEQSSGRFWDTDKIVNIYPMNSSLGVNIPIRLLTQPTYLYQEFACL
jgi:hypothetical protein